MRTAPSLFGLVRRAATAVSVAAVLVAVSALPAAAAPLQNERYSGTNSVVECGRYHGAVTFSGRVMIKDATPATGGQFFYFSDNHRFREVVTNPATGAWLTIQSIGIYKETHARLLAGTVFTYETHDVGQPVIFRDSAGKILLHDRGVIVQSYVFDTLGDSQPGGDPVSGPELVRVSGPHPAFDPGFDFCAFVASVIG